MPLGFQIGHIYTQKQPALVTYEAQLLQASMQGVCVSMRQPADLTLPVRIVMQPSPVRVTELGSGRSGMAFSSVSAREATVRCRAS